LFASIVFFDFPLFTKVLTRFLPAKELSGTLFISNTLFDSLRCFLLFLRPFPFFFFPKIPVCGRGISFLPSSFQFDSASTLGMPVTPSPRQPFCVRPPVFFLCVFAIWLVTPLCTLLSPPPPNVRVFALFSLLPSFAYALDSGRPFLLVELFLFDSVRPG